MCSLYIWCAGVCWWVLGTKYPPGGLIGYWVSNVPPLLGGYWVLNVPSGCVSRSWGIRGWVQRNPARAFMALAGLKIPKICLSDMWFLVYRRAGAGDKRGEGGVLAMLHPDLGKGQDLRFIRGSWRREPTVRGINNTTRTPCSPKEAHHDHPLHQDLGR